MPRPTERTVTETCHAVGLTSVGSFTSSFTRTYSRSPTAYRREFRPSAAPVPGCVPRAYGQPRLRTFREEAGKGDG
ncbi:hypothetical protein [Saccharomonospora xinjiangensis]|uniref:hypothetical protein n=1 Tax=Saccharomonospora xinjiangensis TaxID=75294 RepID=UPI001E587B47|nr:hypothetical protein [Saccharomonospora xinjiangensis]